METLTVPMRKKLSVEVSEKFILLSNQFQVDKNTSLEERVTLLLTRDLIRLGWRLKSNHKKALELKPPDNYDKDTIKIAMSYARNEVIERNYRWIDRHIELGRSNLALGRDVLKSEVYAKIEICETEEQHNIFRILRYYWSSPSSDYIGRRIRLLIRDEGVKGNPVIGIAALGSSIIHIPDRDKWIGWDTNTRSHRIIYMMDAYVIGALPPYNYLLGGSLYRIFWLRMNYANTTGKNTKIGKLSSRGE